MKNKQTITIGIPAYNEASNITRLIADLVAQVQRDFLMEKIIVVSDASTDGTADVVEKIRKTRVEVIENRERRGKAHSLNLIKDKSTSDILLLLDADIRIPDTQFINNLITPIVKGQAAITYAKIREDRPTNFLSNILFASMIFKHGILKVGTMATIFIQQ
ncbi:glycosyltransferase [Candidatus Roizmanbacteria bacterium]|nr:MAG: glycosyltransferase [Candidatus Roizmanbacteria bacterium]